MAVAGTSFDRSFPLELDAQHRSAFAKAGDQKPLDSAKQKASPFGGG